MELLQLRYFLESSKNESFAKTAKMFMVPPSSVSSSVKRLEDEIGCNLFDRYANRILLSENGRKFQKNICSIFEELENAISEINSSESENTEIRILAKSSRAIIVNKIIDFHKKHPNIKFDTSFDFSVTDFDNYDIIIDEDSALYPDFDKFELCSYRIGIKASCTSHLCGKALHLNHLKNQPFITMGDNSNLSHILVNTCNKAGFTPNIVIKTNDIGCYRKCIEEGVGLALTRLYQNAASDNPKTVILDIVDFNERQTVYVYYKKYNNCKYIKSFLNILKN